MEGEMRKSGSGMMRYGRGNEGRVNDNWVMRRLEGVSCNISADD
jgi:hypothetical protein